MAHPRHSDKRYWKCMRDFEREMLEFYLNETGWHVASAADMLGIEKSFLYRRMQFVGLEPRGVSPVRRAPYAGKPRVIREKAKDVVDHEVTNPDAEAHSGTEGSG
jgi:hypothetical protein